MSAGHQRAFRKSVCVIIWLINNKNAGRIWLAFFIER
jgi:hypothetical protein